MTFFKMRGSKQGGHVHVDVFSAYGQGELNDVKELTRGKCGTLILSKEEWEDLVRMCKSQVFGLHGSIETEESE